MSLRFIWHGYRYGLSALHCTVNVHATKRGEHAHSIHCLRTCLDKQDTAALVSMTMTWFSKFVLLWSSSIELEQFLKFWGIPWAPITSLCKVINQSVLLCMLRSLSHLVLFQVISGRLLNVHLILDDPAGNSYIQVSVTVLHNPCPHCCWSFPRTCLHLMKTQTWKSSTMKEHVHRMKHWDLMIYRQKIIKDLCESSLCTFWICNE